MLRRFVRRGLNASFLTHFNLLDTKIDLWYFDKPFINYNQMTMLNRVDPERQMEPVIGYIKGDNTQKNVVQKARFAIDKARNPTQDDNINIVRTYTREELSEMESRLDRLEILVIRKRAGEIISPEEIDRAGIQKKKEPIPPVSGVKKEEAEMTPEELIIKIGKEIKLAEVFLLYSNLMAKSDETVTRAINKAREMIDQAKSDGIDVEEQEKMLADLIQRHPKILQSI